MFTFVACGNQQLFDTTYTFNEAIIELPDGTIVRGDVDSWTDMIDFPEQIQIVIDGTTYLTHMSKVVLIAK
jgi:hypothetical protein